MAVLKVAQPKDKEKKAKHGKKSNSKKKSSGGGVGFNVRACLRKATHSIILTFLIVSIIWGFCETLVAMFADFIVNHPQGQDGFTLLPQLEMIDITEYEHQDWEVEEIVKYHQPNERQTRMLAIREKIIKGCSNFAKKDRIQANYHSNCYSLPAVSRNVSNFLQKNYFCAIIEHPQRFHEAYKPLVKLWLATCFISLGSVPLGLFAFVWQSQCQRLLILYMLIQVIPICTSFALLLDLWFVHKFELCALGHMYFDVPVRVIFTLITVIKLIVKGIEITFTIWYVALIHAARERRGYGARLLSNKNGAPMDDEPITLHNEVLQIRRLGNEEEEKPEVDRSKKFGIQPKHVAGGDNKDKTATTAARTSQDKNNGHKKLSLKRTESEAKSLAPEEFLPDDN